MKFRSSGAGQTLAVLLAILAIIGILLSINSARAQTIGTCKDVATNDAIAECLQLNLPSDQAHSFDTVVRVLGNPLGKGVAAACPKDEAGNVQRDKCVVYASTIHRIADAVAVAVFDPDTLTLVQISVAELTPQQKEDVDGALRRGDNPFPGYEPI